MTITTNEARALMLSAESDVFEMLDRYVDVRDALAVVHQDTIDRLVAGLAELVVASADEARAEVERLRRILACEQGDASAAPEGWRQAGPSWLRPVDGGYLAVSPVQSGAARWWTWSHPDEDTRTPCQTAPTALEAMEAADKAAGVTP